MNAEHRTLNTNGLPTRFRFIPIGFNYLFVHLSQHWSKKLFFPYFIVVGGCWCLPIFHYVVRGEFVKWTWSKQMRINANIKFEYCWIILVWDDGWHQRWTCPSRQILINYLYRWMVFFSFIILIACQLHLNERRSWKIDLRRPWFYFNEFRLGNPERFIVERFVVYPEILNHINFTPCAKRPYTQGSR